MVEPLIPKQEVGVRYLPAPCCVLEQRHIYSPKSTGNTQEATARPDMTEKLFTGTLSNNESLPPSTIIQAYMHVLITCKYGYDFIKNSRENVMPLFSQFEVYDFI